MDLYILKHLKNLPLIEVENVIVTLISHFRDDSEFKIYFHNLPINTLINIPKKSHILFEERTSFQNDFYNLNNHINIAKEYTPGNLYSYICGINEKIKIVKILKSIMLWLHFEKRLEENSFNNVICSNFSSQIEQYNYNKSTEFLNKTINSVELPKKDHFS